MATAATLELGPFVGKGDEGRRKGTADACDPLREHVFRPSLGYPRPTMFRASAAMLLLALPACRTAPVEEETSGGDGRVTIGEVSWYVDYEAAVAVARAEQKPLWVHFGENPG